MLKTRPSDISQLEDRSEIVQTIPCSTPFSAPTEAFTNLSAIATENFDAAWRLWVKLLENHVDFASRFFDALHAPSPIAASANPIATSASGSTASNLLNVRDAQGALPRPSSPTPAKRAVVKELPIKRYDELSVPVIVSKMGRLRDADQVRQVLTYEARNKRRKGVATAGKLRLERLANEN